MKKMVKTQAVMKFKCGHEILVTYMGKIGKREIANQQRWNMTRVCTWCRDAAKEADETSEAKEITA